MAGTLSDIRAANKAGASPPYAGLFVVYDLPDRDCAAAASNGEYSVANNGVAYYKAYIDSIVAQLKTYSDIRTILVIEPDSLANLVTNLSESKCANAAAAYYECVDYALEQLNLPNVAMYIDAGHAGWLGWAANLQPAATLFAKVYSDAGKPAALRGLATNVANYNAWNISSAPSYTSGQSSFPESVAGTHLLTRILLFKATPTMTSTFTSMPLLLFCRARALTPTSSRTKAGLASSQPARPPGGIGATPSEPGSAPAPPRTPDSSSRTLSCGSSRAASAMEPATRAPRGTTTTAATRMPSSRHLRPELGSRRTLSSS